MEPILRKLKHLTHDLVESYSAGLLDLLHVQIEQNASRVIDYVEKLRGRDSSIKSDDLARKIITRLSFRAGAAGAVTGIGGPLLVGITLPLELKNTFKIQSDLAMAIAHAYGHDIKSERVVTDILLVMAGGSAIDAMKKKGLKSGTELTRQAMSRYLAGEAGSRINGFISKIIIKKAGENFSVKSLKLAPLLGISLGAFFDYFDTRLMGMRAMQYYRGKKNMVITVSNVSDFVRERVSAIDEIIIDDGFVMVRFSFMKNIIKSRVKLEYLGYADGALLLMIKENFLKKNIIKTVQKNRFNEPAYGLTIEKNGLVRIDTSTILKVGFPGLKEIDILDIRIARDEIIVEL